MKTAISIPDDVFHAAETAARRIGMSRSRFFTEAARLFLQSHGDRGITERLDDVYAEADSKVEFVLSALQLSTKRARSTW